MNFVINKSHSLKENDKREYPSNQSFLSTVSQNWQNITGRSPPTVIKLQYEERKTYLWCYLFISEQQLWNTQAKDSRVFLYPSDECKELGSRNNKFEGDISNYGFQWLLTDVFSVLQMVVSMHACLHQNSPWNTVDQKANLKNGGEKFLRYGGFALTQRDFFSLFYLYPSKDFNPFLFQFLC